MFFVRGFWEGILSRRGNESQLPDEYTRKIFIGIDSLLF
jgi:hypothetical protein